MAAKKCTCCRLHNSTNEGPGEILGKTKPVVQKKKWVGKEDCMYANNKYRITFECFGDDYSNIYDEITAYGSVILEEREVEDNVEE